jgi:hypothetical protein
VTHPHLVGPSAGVVARRLGRATRFSDPYIAVARFGGILGPAHFLAVVRVAQMRCSCRGSAAGKKQGWAEEGS